MFINPKSVWKPGHISFRGFKALPAIEVPIPEGNRSLRFKKRSQERKRRSSTPGMVWSLVTRALNTGSQEGVPEAFESRKAEDASSCGPPL